MFEVSAGEVISGACVNMFEVMQVRLLVEHVLVCLR